MNPTLSTRILIVDDNRSIHDDFRKILRPDDQDDNIDQIEAEFLGVEHSRRARPLFEVDSAYQGEEGIAMYKAALEEGRPYAVAFIDVRMPPGIDGIETADRMWHIHPDVQIVICTAYSDYSWQAIIDRFWLPDQLLVLKKPFTAIEAVQMASALSAKWFLSRQARNHLVDTERIVSERTYELQETKERLEAEIAGHEQTQQHLLRSQRLECIGTLAGGIAHDLNNLISPITLAMQMLHGDVTPALHEELISIVEGCAERAAGVIKQVLTFARGIDGERIPLQLRFSIQEIERIASETFPRSIAVVMSVDPDIHLVEGDATQLQQVLMNLCVNARDAMPDGGTLTISSQNFEADTSYCCMAPNARPGSYVRIRVSDTGMGIPKEKIGRIFEPFFTTKEIGKGSGLGLSSVAGIVKSHGGFIDVQSELGKGATFDILLPAATGEGLVAAPKAEVDEPPMGHGELILVVDDESSIRSVTQATLARHGYRSLAAADGAEAIAIYAQQAGKVHAVLTDLLMPVVDGVMLCRALRKIDPNGPIIVCTGEAGSGRLAELSSLHVDNILSKPYSAQVLLAAVDHALS